MKAMRKKSFAAFLALALLVLVLSSCTFDGSGTQQSPSSQDSQESLDQESSSSESEAQEPAEEDIKGEWKGDVYTNRYLNLSFALPEGWTAASDEEMLEMMDLGSELMDNEAGLVSELLKVKVIYNMMAADNTTGNNIIVSMENLALTVGGTSIDEEAYAEMCIRDSFCISRPYFGAAACVLLAVALCLSAERRHAAAGAAQLSQGSWTAIAGRVKDRPSGCH